jgi:DNA-binding response OmpR family regulator
MAEAPLPMQLVLVDDDPNSYATLHQILEQADLEFESGANFGEASLVMRGEKQRYLVLLNAHTDPIAGLQFMSELSRNPDLRARSVVVDIARALGNTTALPARTADRVIERPINQQELLALIRGYLDAES